MFVRKKKNRSGSTTVVVVDKTDNGYREIKNFGTTSDSSEIQRKYIQAIRWVSTY